MTKLKILPNPFTPKSGMEPRVFVGREKEVECFTGQLEKARQKYADHFLIRGNWGVGKTSLLKEYKKLAQSKKILSSFVTVREFQESDKFIQATQQLITQIPRHLPIKHEKLKNLLELTTGLGLTLPLIGGGVQFAEKKELTGDPQVLLIDALVRLWNDLKDKTDVAVILLDDIQNYAPISGYLTILKNVLSDEEIVKETGFLFVLASTFAGWKRFLQKHHPIGRYFSPSIKLSNLGKEEVCQSINETLKKTGVKFSEFVMSKIFEYTEGQPLELQIICSYLYDNQVGGIVDEQVWGASLMSALEHLGEILLAPIYNLASPQEWEFLKTLSKYDRPFEAKSACKTFKQGVARKLLSRLEVKGLLIKKERGLYAFPDRMFREYVYRRAKD